MGTRIDWHFTVLIQRIDALLRSFGGNPPSIEGKIIEWGRFEDDDKDDALKMLAMVQNFAGVKE